MVADTTDKFQESLLETEVLNSNTDDGYFLLHFFYPLYNGNVSLFYRRALLLLSEITKKNAKRCSF